MSFPSPPSIGSPFAPYAMIESFPSPPLTAFTAVLPTLTVSSPAPPLKIIPYPSAPPSTLSAPPFRLMTALPGPHATRVCSCPVTPEQPLLASISDPLARWKMIAGGLFRVMLKSSTPSVP